MEKTYFISFEGIDGCGKDTQLHNLIDFIREDDNYPFGDKYSNIWVTREPSKITPSGLKISNLIREKNISGKQASELFIKDRIEHSKIIKQILKHSHVLISRYDLSTLSYQMSQGEDFDKLYKMHKFGQENGCIIPDITIIFKLSAKIAQTRTNSRKSKIECFENLELQTKIEQNLDYCIKEIKKRDNRKIIIINAEQTIKQITQEMVQKIHQTINQK